MGWFLVNVMAPMFLPMIGILPLRLLPIGAPQTSLRVMATVKDGQLCWAAIAMGASMIFELWQALESHKPLPSWTGTALASVILAMLISVVLAAGGSVFNTTVLTAPAGGMKPWLAHYRVFGGSAIMTGVTVVAYTALHFAIPR
jgi:hypothetical protein